MENLLEAVEFKNEEQKRIFNRSWKEQVNEILAGKDIYLAYQGESSYSRQKCKINGAFVGAKTGNLLLSTSLGNKSLNDFNEIGFKKPHLEAEDENLNLQILSLVDAYKAAYNDAAKRSNSLNRGETGRIERAKKTADAILKSPRCEELKKWLAEHITKILFKLPICSDPAEIELDDTLSPEDFEKIAERWQFAADKFLELWNPALVEGVDFIYRDALKEPETVSSWYKFRGPVCLLTFDVSLSSTEVPEEVDEMIQLAKHEAEENGVDRRVSYDVDSSRLESYYTGRALGEIFNYNINFYKGVKSSIPPEEIASSDNVFKQDFDDINAYGEKVTESLTEDKEEICCICGEPIEGYGNNPEPYKHEGRCCDACNMKFVIPARLARLNNNEE